MRPETIAPFITRGWVMISTHKTIPSEKSKEILKTLKKIVAETLERKRKLGHYVVVWDGEKPVQRGSDAPNAEE